jgi:DNA polymerase III subunit delta
LDELVRAASICDGLVKGLKHPDWPADAWDGLRALVLMLLQPLARQAPGGVPMRLALRA